MVVYGEPKLGKTTFGSETPAPIFVTTEDGANGLDIEQFPKADEWGALLANIRQVAEGDHKYKTLVVDTLNGAADLGAQHICKTAFNNDWGEKGFASFGKGWDTTSEEMRKLLPLLDACRDRGMMVLLLAHTGVNTVRNPIDGDYSKFQPALNRKIWGRFSAWADIILRADFEYTVAITDKKAHKGRVIGTTTRILKCSGSAAEDAGCRAGFELPDVLPFSWQAVADALGKDNETLGEVKKRWGLLPAERQAKALAHYGVRKLEDLAVGRLRQLLNHLKTIEVKSEKGVAE
jgi:hypothetical protein